MARQPLPIASGQHYDDGGAPTTAKALWLKAIDDQYGAAAVAADKTINSNISGAAGGPAWNTLSAILDNIIGSTRGMTIVRGAALWQALALGGSGQILRSDGTDLVFAAPSVPRQLLATLTANNSATLSDTTSLTSTYDVYELDFIHLVPTTDAKTIQLQVHSGGSFPATNYISTVIDEVNGGGMAGNTTNTTAIQLTNTNGFKNAAPGLSGRVTIYQPSITNAVKMIGGVFWGNNTGGTFASQFFTSGYWNGGNGAIDGFQVFSGTLNTNLLTSGMIKVYGLT